jgi:hypothetical protein
MRSAGTALYLSYNNKNYLLTARHVIYDATSADTNKIANMIILIENYTERDIKDTFYADRNSYTFVGDYHFLVFNSSIKNRPPYLFSSVNEDLALIDLSDGIMGLSFNNTLGKRGYRPISINDIDTLCKIEYGQNIMAVGFPLESEVDTNRTSPVLDFRSRFVSLPIISEGITNGKYNDIYFDAFLWVYHGFSGGPIIRNNKLIGIVHGFDLPFYTTNSAQLPYYRWFGLLLIKSSLIMPLLRKMESTGGI